MSRRNVNKDNDVDDQKLDKDEDVSGEKRSDLEKNGIVIESTNPLCNPTTCEKKTFKHAALPRWEFLFCVAVMVGFLGYMKYRTAVKYNITYRCLRFVKVYFALNFSINILFSEHFGALRLNYLPKAWLPAPFGSGKRDNADFEWMFFKKNFLSKYTLYEIVIYVIGGRLAEAFFPKFRNHFILVFNIGVLTTKMSPGVFGLFMAHTTVAYLASWTGVHLFVWVVGLLQVLTVVASQSFVIWQESIFPGFSVEMIGFTFGVMRCISFGLECCNHPEKNYGLFDFLLYHFYYPQWSFGPVITFDQFYKEINKECRLLNKSELWHIIRQVIRLAFWYLYIEFILHYLFFNAFHRHPAVFRKLPPADLVVLAGCHMLFFQNKYVLMYGCPAVVALFDRVIVPQAPLCPMGVFSFREMWRYFDRGLHNMLMRYIYVPLGGSKYGMKWASFSSFITFAAMGLWHGNTDRHYLWAFCNWLWIQVELVVSGWAWSPKALEYQRSLSGPMLRRVCGIVAAINQLLLSTFSMIFISGLLPVFFIYAKGLFITGFPWMPVVLFIFYYFNVQLDYEVQRKYTFEYVYNKKYY